MDWAEHYAQPEPNPLSNRLKILAWTQNQQVGFDMIGVSVVKTGVFPCFTCCAYNAFCSLLMVVVVMGWVSRALHGRYGLNLNWKCHSEHNLEAERELKLLGCQPCNSVVIEAPFGFQLDLHENEQTRGFFYFFSLGLFGLVGQVRCCRLGLLQREVRKRMEKTKRSGEELQQSSKGRAILSFSKKMPENLVALAKKSLQYFEKLKPSFEKWSLKVL